VIDVDVSQALVPHSDLPIARVGVPSFVTKFMPMIVTEVEPDPGPFCFCAFDIVGASNVKYTPSVPLTLDMSAAKLFWK
jgi:hypothetical protein